MFSEAKDEVMSCIKGQVTKLNLFFNGEEEKEEEEKVPGEDTLVLGWEVWWTRRHGEYSGDIKKAVRLFIKQEDAVRFKYKLDAAFKVIQHTSNIGVKVIRQRD